jgi:hypothetical protein
LPRYDPPMGEDRTAVPLPEEPPGQTSAVVPPATANGAAALPSSIGRFRIIRLLGEGGMGSVYDLIERGQFDAFITDDKKMEAEAQLRALSLLLCTVGFGEARLFLRNSRVGSGCFVYTRSENALVPSLSRS